MPDDPHRGAAGEVAAIPGHSGALWGELLAKAIERGVAEIAFQPIIDLEASQVAGYESLARFAGPPGLTPDLWFRAARERGLAHHLDALVLDAVLAWRAGLPQNCFLTVNLEPESLCRPEIEGRLTRAGDLEGLVIELTSQPSLEARSEIERHLPRYRDLGVLVALDDAASGYAGLQEILRLHPALLKLDQPLVRGIERDRAKLAMVEMLVTLADRIDAWIVAEGVERPEEATVLREVGVQLAQGYFFARPTPYWSGLDPRAIRHLRELAGTGVGPRLPASLRSLISPTPAVAASGLGEARRLLASDDTLEWVVLLDSEGRPNGFLDRDGALAGGPRPLLSMDARTPLAEAGRRMVARPPGERLEPAACCDEAGRYLGTVRAEQVLEALARRATS